MEYYLLTTVMRSTWLTTIYYGWNFEEDAYIPSQDSTQDSTIFRFPVIFTSCKSHDYLEEGFVAIMEGKLELGLGLG